MIYNAEYVAARVKLIPEAEAFADELAGPMPETAGLERQRWANTWNRSFHSRMDQLAREHGLLGQRP